MIIKIDNISLPLKHDDKDIRKKIAKKIRRENFDYEVFKKSIDSRKKHDIKIIYSFLVYVDGAVKGFSSYKKKIYQIKKADFKTRPIVVGFGPAGMFLALVLARAGARPIVFERGSKVEDRIKDVEKFFNEGVLDPNSNIQFGEGGAGTFSDGKLSTGIKDKFGRKDFVLDEFVRAGAEPCIKYLNKPHVGTDYLVRVVRNIREEIISLGGEVHFDSLVNDLRIENDEIKGVYVSDLGLKKFASSSAEARNSSKGSMSGDFFLADTVVFATGHSSRDTFEMLYNRQIDMESKPFAVGLRIEHPQDEINKAQYGDNELSEHLLTADYKLTYRTKEGRAVYSFCMCPGGFVVNSSSEEGRLCVNGMSNYKRNSNNANSAIVVGINEDDWASDYGRDVLSGLHFQRDLEEKAFNLGKKAVTMSGKDDANAPYTMPLQLFADYKKGQVSSEFAKFKPVNKGFYAFADLNEIFPEYINESIKEAIGNFGRKIKGFDRDDAILTGVEARTSSPIRIVRNEEMASNIKGLYFSGEGAGYAGGIMSAAIDGIKIAESIIDMTK